MFTSVDTLATERLVFASVLRGERMSNPLHAPAWAVAVLCGACGTADAQWWLDVPSGKVPRNAAGRPDLTAPAPRLADGRPDLSGVWEPIKTYSRDLSADLHPSTKTVPFQPWAKTLAEARADGSHSRDDPPAQCLPQGVP